MKKEKKDLSAYYLVQIKMRDTEKKAFDMWLAVNGYPSRAQGLKALIRFAIGVGKIGRAKIDPEFKEAAR